MKFLKYGGEKLNDVLDLELAFNCLWSLILDGSDTLTYSRAQVLNHRYEKNPFKDFVEAVEKKTENNTENEPSKKSNKKKDKKTSATKQTSDDKKSDVVDSVVDASVEATESSSSKETQKVEQKEEPKVDVSKPEPTAVTQTTVNEEKKGLFKKMKEKFKAKTPQSNDTATEVKKAETVVKEKKAEQ